MEMWMAMSRLQPVACLNDETSIPDRTEWWAGPETVSKLSSGRRAKARPDLTGCSRFPCKAVCRLRSRCRWVRKPHIHQPERISPTYRSVSPFEPGNDTVAEQRRPSGLQISPTRVSKRFHATIRTTSRRCGLKTRSISYQTETDP